MAYKMPLVADLITARSSVLFGGPPMLMFATAGLTACFVTQSTPLITDDAEKNTGSHVVTFTAVIGAPGSAPTTSIALSDAASTPATRVPCAHAAVFGVLVKFT